MNRITKLSLIGLSVLSASCGGGSGGSTTTPPPVIVVNNPPVVSQANANQSATVGQAFSYDVTQGGTVFTDADGNTLAYSISYSPDANGLSDTNGIISGTPVNTGTYTITVSASDGNGGTMTDIFDLIVSAATVSTKPNILLIISDDQGVDSSAQYALSSDAPNTPILDGLAQNGFVFNNAWVYPVCSPTRASMITGKYGLRTSVFEPGDELDVSETVLHSFLASDSGTSDYATALVGKWHLSRGSVQPSDHGISHFAGITGGGVGDYYSWPLNVNGNTTTSTNYATTELTDQAINWVGAQSDPWFLWLAYNAPHTPFHLPPQNLHSPNLPGGQTDIDNNSRDYYRAAIEAMDTEIGRLLDALPADVRNNTVILFVGDNGTPGAARDQAVYANPTKGSLSEGGVCVPMIVSGAGVARTNEREEALVNGSDFFTTIAELAGSTTISQYDIL